MQHIDTQLEGILLNSEVIEDENRVNYSVKAGHMKTLLQF